MDQLLRQRARHHLIEDEGMKTELYRDTAGKLTIGVGRNIEDNGIRESEALFFLDNDLDYFNDWLSSNFPWFLKLDSVRQLVVIMMAFNLGNKRFLSFKKMISSLERHDYQSAANEMLDSKWATQIKGRAVKLANMMRSGVE